MNLGCPPVMRVGRSDGPPALLLVGQDGDLDGYLRRRAGRLLDEDEVMSKFVQAALAVQYIHNKVAPQANGGLPEAASLIFSVR